MDLRPFRRRFGCASEKTLTLLSLAANCNRLGCGSTIGAGAPRLMTGEADSTGVLDGANAPTVRMPPRMIGISPEMDRTGRPSFSLSSTGTACCFAFTRMEHLHGRANRPRDRLGCRRPAWRSFFESWTHIFPLHL